MCLNLLGLVLVLIMLFTLKKKSFKVALPLLVFGER